MQRFFIGAIAVLALASVPSVSHAQIVTATASPINLAPPNAVWTMKVEGTFSVQTGQSMQDITLVVGTITNGVFTPRNPPMQKVINQFAPVNNTAPYYHVFTMTTLPAGTWSVEVKARYTQTAFPFPWPRTFELPPVYSTMTIQ